MFLIYSALCWQQLDNNMARIPTILIISLLSSNIVYISTLPILKKENQELCISGKLDQYNYQPDLNPENVTFELETTEFTPPYPNQSISLVVNFSYKNLNLTIPTSGLIYEKSKSYVSVNMHNMCFTGDLTLTLKACSSLDPPQALGKMNAQRNLLRRIFKENNVKNFIKINRTLDGKLRLDGISYLKMLDKFDCPDVKLMFWVVSGNQIVSKKVEVPIGAIHTFRELEFDPAYPRFRCNSSSNLELHVLGRFNDSSPEPHIETSARYDEEALTFKLLGEIPSLTPKFEWNDDTKDLWLKDTQKEGLKGCFKSATFLSQSNLKGNDEGFNVGSHYYCLHPSFQITVNNQNFSYTPKFGLKYLENITLDIISIPFKQCENISLEIECMVTNEIDTKSEILREVFHANLEFSIPSEKFLGKYCKILRYMEEYIFIGIPEETGHVTSIIIGVLGIVCFTLLGVFLLIYKKKIPTIRSKFPIFLKEIQSTTEKDKDVTMMLKTKMEDFDELRREFENLDKISHDEIEPSETYDISHNEKVIKNQRNRYKNILPFDSNVVMLETPKGKM